ncbi:MAG: ATP-dependent RecD-like DNA helicase [Deltaproteobacteria bacterium]|jgi:exodeoxyribonuclease V alpha subunit|nr:ATP-dependent RecD-like DNA helicase [Deltaproteobacteria bacterium]
MTESLAGQIEKVSYLNDETGFSIVMLKVDGRREAVTAVGQLSSPAVGELVDMTGEFKRHPRFGLQFEVASCASRPPENETGLAKYLGSGLIKGVGPILAKRMVDAFGQSVLDVLDNEPERMTEVRGLGPVRRERIIEAWRSTAGLKQLLSFLSTFGLGPALAIKILKRFGSGAEEAIRQDPYRLAYEIHGIGFLIADKVAKTLGFAPDCPQRLEAGLLFCLDGAVRRGHDYLPSGELIQDTRKLIPEAQPLALEEALSRVSVAGRVIAERQDEPGQLDVYLPQTHRAENWVARSIASILAAPFSVAVPRPEKALAWAEGTMGLELNEDQRQAAILAITQKCSIVTGGPGTGKTTMTKAVCGIWKAVTGKVALVAPTGRAAKRLSQATGYEATTIHRLLEYAPSDGGFIHGPENRLDLDMLLVDESSMLDVLLMNQLLGALPSKAALVLVGDQDQLPPVGPGRVLPDLLESGLVPSKRLTKIYRQAEQGQIITAAHMINSGQTPAGLGTSPDSDFFFVPEEDHARIIDKILKLVCERIPRKLGLDPRSDIMVLSPTKKGELGTVNLNTHLGRALNPAMGPSVNRFGQILKIGDRVMQNRNDYAKEVYNGDLGRVFSIDMEDQELRVAFDDRKAVYDFSELDELSLAWASTVHKAQGSEFPAVVIPVHPSHHIMLRRKLIYTAVTRGRRMVFLVGSTEALRRSVLNNHEDQRYSHLDRLLAEALRQTRARSGL